MKKISLIFLVFLLLFININVVNASPIFGENKEERTQENNYGVNKKWDMSDENRIKKASEIPYVDASINIFDYENLLTDTQKEEVEKLIANYENKTGYDFVFLTFKKHYYYDSENEDWISNFYDYNDFGLNDSNYDGVLYYINMDDNNKYAGIASFGDAQLSYGDYVLNSITSVVFDDLGKHNYYDSVITCLKQLDKRYNPDNDDYYVDDYSIIQYYKKDTKKEKIFTGIAIGFVVAVIAIIIMINKNKMVKSVLNANVYLDKSSKKYNMAINTLISSVTTHHKIETTSSSGGGGGSHIGSSGGGHSHSGGHF